MREAVRGRRKLPTKEVSAGGQLLLEPTQQFWRVDCITGLVLPKAGGSVLTGVSPPKVCGWE